MTQVEIRIKRPRTTAKLSTWELLERFASLEGRTIPNTLEGILSGLLWERWREFVWNQNNPGKATT